MELLALWDVLKRRRYYALFVALGVVVLTVASLLLQTPLYEGHARIVVEFANTQRSAAAEAAPMLETRNEINSRLDSVVLVESSQLTSRVIQKAVIEKLGLKDESGQTISEIPVRQPSVFGFGSSRAIWVQRWGRTDCLDVYAYSPSLDEAADTANTMVEAYVRWRKENLTNDLGFVIEYVEAQYKSAEEEFKQSLGLIRSHQENAGMDDLDTESRELIQQFAALEAERMETERQLSDSKARLETLVSQIEDAVPVSPGVNRKKSAEAYDDRNARLYRNSDPAFADIEREYKSFQAKLATIEKQIPELQQRIMKIPALRASLSQLDLKKEVAEETSRTLMRALNDIMIARAVQYSNIRIVETASVPKKPKPYRPVFLQRILLGVLLALVAGVGSAVFVEYVDDKISSAAVLQKTESVQFLGTIPKLPVMNKKLQIPNDANDPGYEAFRKIYHNLRVLMPEGNIGRVLFSAPIPHSGVTSMVYGLGRVLGHDGHNVLVADLDLRRAKLHELLDSARSPGLADVLADGMSIDDVLGKDDPAFLGAGTPVADAGHVLKSLKVAELLKTLGEKFEMMLCDSAPVLIKTDAIHLAPLFDAVILIVAAGKTSTGELREAVRLLSRARKGPIFVIINEKK